MAWYDDLLSKENNPLAGVGDSFKDINLFGAEVPEQFTQMREAGLLTPEAYTTAVNKADKSSKRNAIIQGLLAYGSQDFNRNTGSILPYLTKPIAVAMNAAQKEYDVLPTQVTNLSALKEMKRKQDSTAEADRIMKIGLYKTNKDKDGNLSLDVNYDILNESFKTGDIDFTKDVSSILTSRAAMAKASLDSLNSKYKISEKGDRVFLIPKSGVDGQIREFVNGTIVDVGPDNPYQGTPEKPYMPTAPQTEPFAEVIKGRFERDKIKIDPDDAKQIALEVIGQARQYKEKNPSDTRDVYEIGYQMAKAQYNSSRGILNKITKGVIGTDTITKRGTSENPYSIKNPFKGTAEQIKNFVKKGDYYINPNDNQVYQKLN